jgi:hypothetical protein
VVFAYRPYPAHSGLSLSFLGIRVRSISVVTPQQSLNVDMSYFDVGPLIAFVVLRHAACSVLVYLEALTVVF